MSSATRVASAPRRGYLALSANLAFVLLWTGQLISYLGDRLDQMTLLRMAQDKTLHPDAIMTRMGFFILLPFVLFAPLAGAAADRYSRKAILVVTSLCQGLIILTVPFIGSTALVQDHLVATIYLVTFLIGSFTVFFYTAKTALIPQLVANAELMAANSLCSFAGILMALAGTFVAYGLLGLVARGHVGVEIMFRIDAATYFIAGAMFAMIAIPREAKLARPAIAESFGRKVRNGLHYVRGHRQVLKLIVLSVAVYFVGGLMFTAVNGATLGLLEWSAQTYALAVGILGVSMLVGAVAATLGQRRIRSLEFFAAGCFAIAAVCLLPFFSVRRVARLGMSQGIAQWAILAPLFLVIGAAGGALIVLVITRIQRGAPRRFHGRVLALNSMCDVAALLLALGGGALLLQHGRQATALAIAIALAIVASLGTLMGGEFSRHWLVRTLVRLFSKFYCRMESDGREHVPRRGPLIVASNHVGWLDALFVSAAVPRLLHFIAAREYYELWYLKWIMWLFGTIPVERGKGHRRPFNRALAALQRGRVIGMFPEGRMSRDGRLQPLVGGVALMAAQTGAPILPVAVLGSREVMGPRGGFPRPHKVHVRIGKPIDPRGLSRDEILARVEAAIRGLLERGN